MFTFTDRILWKPFKFLRDKVITGNTERRFSGDQKSTVKELKIVPIMALIHVPSSLSTYCKDYSTTQASNRNIQAGQECSYGVD